MAIMSGEQYIESLRKIKSEVYYLGERIDNIVDHPSMRPHINAAAETYDMAFDPQHKDLGSAVSHLDGEKINRFTHIHQSSDDLVKEMRLLRLLSQRTGSCYQRCVGHDALNATYQITYEMDQKNGTNYHQRFIDYLKYIQSNDLMVVGGMTDTKGDRSLRPSQQADPDLYMRVVKKNKNGIVVRGAKAHMTGSANSHEFLALPTRALGPADQDYAVAFAIPCDTKGVIHIFGRQTNDTRRLEEGEIDKGNFRYGVVGGECLVVFDDVFVPWERVFMCGEYDFAYPLVERFAAFHRSRYGACKGGIADIVVGAAAAIAEFNGTDKSAHIIDKLTEMVLLTETSYCCSIAAAAQASKTASGAYFVDPIPANASKQNITRHPYEIDRLAHDIAGGLIATLPSEKDLTHPKVGKFVKKYLKGVADVPTEHRMRLFRLIENMTGGTALVEGMHGAGSPQTQRIMLIRLVNLEYKKTQALRLAGINQK